VTADGFGWRSLLFAAAATSFILFVVSALALSDKEPVVFAVLVLAGMLLARGRRARWGAALLGLVFAHTLVWMFPGALSTITHDGPTVDLFLPAAHTATSLGGLAGVLGFSSRKDERSTRSRAARWVGMTVLGLLAVTLIANLALSHDEASTPRPGDVTLSSDNTAFSKTTLTADPGQITVFLSNGDLAWHTFTIDGLKVDLKAPVGADRALTFSASPGSYPFYCRIPGHELAGMRGTLLVR